jgi:hypothetical protein
LFDFQRNIDPAATVKRRRRATWEFKRKAK